jgi:hypothetical protein
MIPQIEDPDALVSPVMAKDAKARGIRAPMKMKTPGMGTMMGGPKRKGLPAMGKIEPGATPFESGGMKKGGSVSKRADGCCIKGKTKGKFV